MRHWYTKIRKTPFFIKLMSWEYWPAYITNIPTVLIWLWFAFKARKLFFFSSVNPAMDTGGMLGASKFKILGHFPKKYLPHTLLVKKDERKYPLVYRWMQQNEIQFPLILKPDIGERGFLVEKVNTPEALRWYLSRVTFDVIVQEYVDLPAEISVFYHKLPGQAGGQITSLCLKESLHVIGDGTSTVGALMLKSPRAILQFDRLLKINPKLLQVVPSRHEMFLIEPIANHSRGTKFLNGNDKIDQKLERKFDQLFEGIDGINYGRFDLRCRDLEDLKNGGEIKLLEFNGVASEPAHIYDPDYPIWKVYRDFYRHWEIMYRIYRLQKSVKISTMSLWEAAQKIIVHFRYLRDARLRWAA